MIIGRAINDFRRSEKSVVGPFEAGEKLPDQRSWGALKDTPEVRSEFALPPRHELTSMNNCFRLIQPTIIMDISVIGNP